MAELEPPEPWRAIFKPETTGQYLFHYTRLSTALEAILPLLRLRFSRFSAMRDPRESKWAFAAAFFGELPRADELYSELSVHLHRARENVRILSLTADQDPIQHELFGRGFARPRLWEQYAGNHVGVCLCFEREPLITAVSKAVDGIGAELFHRRVHYRDGSIAPRASQFDLQDARQLGSETAIAQHIAEHVDELFFTKLTDWASENEYRFITPWDSPDDVYVDVNDALKAVVLGHAVSRSYGPSFYALCEPRAVGVAKVEWMNGRPWVYRAAREPPLPLDDGDPAGP